MLVRKLRLSTGQTLSILTTAVVVTVLAVGIAVTWATLRRAALDVAQDRMTRGVRQLATVSAMSLRQTQQRYQVIAEDPQLRRALEGPAPDLAAARVVLGKFVTPGDSGMPVELWRAKDHQRVAFVGDNVPPPAALNVGGEDHAMAASFRPGLDSLPLRDSTLLGQLYPVGPRSYFWMVVPVLDSGRPIGFVLKQGRVATNPMTERTVRELVGDSVSGYYRNADGTNWTTFGGNRTEPTERSAADRTVRSRPDVGRSFSPSNGSLVLRS